MTTTFRDDIVAALVVILEAQVTATPTLLRKVYASRPGSFAELPVAWVGSRSEDITHDSGTRTRTFSGLTVTIADNSTTESGPDRLDQLVDALVDRFTAAVSAVPGTILECTSVADTEIELVGSVDGAPRSSYYRAVEFRFARTFVKEGRT